MGKRFLVSPRNILPDGRVVLPVSEVRHLTTVLRMGPGDEVELFDGAGRTFRAHLETVGTGSAIAKIDEEYPRCRGESPLDIELIQAIPSGNQMDGIVRKTTEIGVGRIRPVTSLRCQMTRSTSSRVRRWQRIAGEAAKQCRRSVVPEIYQMEDAREVLARPLSSAGWILDPGGSPLGELVGLRFPPAGRISLAVGPEGGWDPGEIAVGREAGFKPVSLGDRVLRVETASVLMIGLLQFLFGDLGKSR